MLTCCITCSFRFYSGRWSLLCQVNEVPGSFSLNRCEASNRYQCWSTALNVSDVTQYNINRKIKMPNCVRLPARLLLNHDNQLNWRSVCGKHLLSSDTVSDTFCSPHQVIDTDAIHKERCVFDAEKHWQFIECREQKKEECPLCPRQNLFLHTATGDPMGNIKICQWKIPFASLGQWHVTTNSNNLT